MSSTNNLTIEDRIEYVKEKIEFFNRPLIYLFPIYPEDDGDEYTSPREFNIDIIDIESEFVKFQDKFNSVFTTKSEKKIAIKYFDQYFNKQLGFVTVPDESVPGGERYQFDWAKLVFYLIKEYEGSSNYWEYFRNWHNDGNDHIFKGYDEKIEQMALEAHKGLINKFETFKKEKEIEIFEGGPLPVENESDKNQPSTHIDQKIKERQEELRRSIKADINTLDMMDEKLKSFLDTLLNKLINGRYVKINRTNDDYKIEYIDVDSELRNVTSQLDLVFRDLDKLNVLIMLQYCENKFLNIWKNESAKPFDNLYHRFITDDEKDLYEFIPQKISKEDEKAIYRYILEIFDKNRSYFSKYKESTILNLSLSTQTEQNSILKDFNFEWAGDSKANKYEISELIQVLFLSNRIWFDGKPITQQKLIDLFNKLFSKENLTSSKISTNLKEGYSVRIDPTSLKFNQFLLESIKPKFIEYLQNEFKKDQNKKIVN